MNEMIIFNNAEFGNIRTVQIDGEMWFAGKDVAVALGYGDTDQAIRKHVDDEDKLTRRIDGSGQSRAMTVINESGLHSLVLSSKLPGAKKFKRWVTSEILPTVRKHGAYMTPEKLEEVLLSPDTLIRLAGNLKEEQEKRKKLELKVQEDRPKVLFADAVSTAHTSILIGELAKLIRQNGVDIGEKRLFAWLRENGYLIKRSGSDWNMPTQKAMDMKLLEIKETVVSHTTHTAVKKTPKVTGKGQQYFISKFLEKKDSIADEIAV